MMERQQILATMGELKLFGMKAAYDEIIKVALKRSHEPQQIVGDLLQAEISEKQARSIRYQMTIAKLPWPRTSPSSPLPDADQRRSGARPLRRRVPGPPAQRRAGGRHRHGKTHLAIAVARSCIRDGARARFYNVVDLVNRLEAEARAGRQGRIADHLARSTWWCWTNSATCRSRSRAVSCCST